MCKKNKRDCTCVQFSPCPGRPHYHALLFGYDFPDKVLWREVRGNPVYTSELLERIWGQGFCTIGEVTFASAAYVARYILKKHVGKTAPDFYVTTDHLTGEITRKHPEYTSMSLKPGIAAGWFEKFSDDVFPNDFVVLKGKIFKTPRFYDRELKKMEGGEAVLEQVKAAREENALRRAYDNSTKRLVVREEVELSKLKRLSRGLDDET